MRYGIQRIAVATNFTAEADHALQYASILAKKYNAGLDIIHAVAPARLGKSGQVSAAYSKLKALREKVVIEHGIEAKVFSRMDGLTGFIYKYCVDNNTDLLLIGVQNHAKKYFGDSKSYEIIKKIECPVLSIPLSFNKADFGHILFPVRDVEGVEEKLLYSRPFMEKNRSELHLINFGKQTNEALNEIFETAQNAGISVFVEDYSGDGSTKNISSKIISVANEKGDDLIVINATSEKDWYRVFGENYTEYILKEADIPVLSITHAFESAGIN